MNNQRKKLNERGMIFNSEMVLSILDGRKTQTRRIIKNQHQGECWSVRPASNPCVSSHTHDWWLPSATQPYSALICPFGKIGDRLWVRETWSLLGNEDGCAVDWDENIVFDQKNAARIYKASCWQKPNNYGLWSIPNQTFEFEGRWKPSIHMPHWASRITLEITDVRVERLNEISEEDAGKEGYPADPYPYGGIMDKWLWFRGLWDSIYPDQSFKHNPWVWVVEFRVLECRQ